MFKKTMGFVAVAAAFAGLGLATGVTANAADTTTNADAQKVTSANVNLKSGDTGTGAGGVILNSAPQISFAGVTLDGTATKTEGTLEKADSSKGGDVQVTNPGVQTDWTVKLTASQMKSTKDNVLMGGHYTLSTDKATTTEATPAVDETSGSDGATVVSNPATSLATAKSITIDTGEETTQDVMKSAEGSGTGVWNTNYAGTTELSIPAQAVGDDYTSTLTWTLTNTPQA